ncbi:MAG: polysaccharide export protein [Desulfobulbaceae bacterium]|nr:polysaccharide export protein [Desulfobulbaceae bacterium]
MKTIKSLILFLIVAAIFPLNGKTADLSVSEAVIADPAQELAEMAISGDQQPVFGNNLFKGHFRDIKQPGFNKDYLINIGDLINIRIWGAFEFSAEIPVDTQGNIFLPKVGTVQVLGVKNKNLVSVVENKIKKSYKDMVFVYANVSSYQPITVFVTGNVNGPGLYQGMSTDSVLQYLDRAGGIALKYGSFRNIEIYRGSKIVKQIDLYSFLVNGRNDLFQFHSGDVISVNNIMNQVTVTGDVKRPFKFEFAEKSIPLKQVLDLAMLKPETTNFTLTRWQRDNQEKSISGSLKNIENLYVMAGDSLDFFSDHTSRLNKISITGEHDGLTTVLVKKEDTLGDVLLKIRFNLRSNPAAVQVFRKSVAEQQKQLLLAHLQNLESTILRSSSMTSEESEIRSIENKTYMGFIERAKKVEPKGQIVINEKTDLHSIYLEEGDQVYIPAITNLADVQGEVSIPGTHTFVDGYSAYDYIQMTGGLTDSADDENILIVAQNGRVKKYESESELKDALIQNGDSVLVMPKVTGYNLQVVKSVTQIMYQIAISVGVLLAI